MDERLREILGDEDAWVVGGAVRDELLLRPVLDLDVACARAARRGESLRPSLRRRRSSRSPSGTEPGGSSPTARRDGRLHAARRRDRRRPRDARLHVQRDRGAACEPARRTILTTAAPISSAGVVRAVSESIFVDDPLRLLRAVRFEDELGFRMDERTEALLRASAHARDGAGRRADRSPSSSGSRRPATAASTSVGLLAPLGGCARRPARRARRSRLPARRRVRRAPRALPDLERAQALLGGAAPRAPPEDPSPRSIHRFRRDTEPWALDALAFVGAPELVGVVEAARRADPAGAARPR